ncbi:MAG: hypothetical protein ACI82A_002644 [Candidatus Azotimanducaceae bacterium]|jgi:hypothetical protein
MTLQDLGAIGELIGGIAVIVSFIYLALQVRHGMRGYRSNITQEVTNHFSRLQFEVAKDAELLDVWRRAERGEDLTDIEQRRVTQIVSSYMIAFENMFYQYREGMMDPEGYEARRPIMAFILSYSGAQYWWENFGSIQHPHKFVQEVEQVIKEFQGHVQSPLVRRRLKT